MLLHEAAAIADEFDAVISRKAWRGIMEITPTNSPECCIVYAEAGEKSKRAPRWNPCLEDLIADDWTVTRVKIS